MATLTDPEAGVMRRTVYTVGQGKEECKALASLPTKAQWKAAFQVLENLWENNKVQIKADVETALGRSITNPLAKKIGLAFLLWKVTKGG